LQIKGKRPPRDLEKSIGILFRRVAGISDPPSGIYPAFLTLREINALLREHKEPKPDIHFGHNIEVLYAARHKLTGVIQDIKAKRKVRRGLQPYRREPQFQGWTNIVDCEMD